MAESAVRSLSACSRFAARFGPLTVTSTGVGEPKLITRLTMSLGSNENLTSGMAAASFSRNRFFGTTRPEVNCVDGKVRRLHADEAERDVHVRRADFGFDGVEHISGDDFRALDARARGCAQPQLELAHVHIRKNLRAETTADH